MTPIDFKINPEPVSEDAVERHRDFDALMRSYQIKNKNLDRRSRKTPLHRKKWVVIGLAALMGFILFTIISGYFVTFWGNSKVETPIEYRLEEID